MKKKFLITSVLFFSYAFFLAEAGRVSAAVLKFDKSSVTTNVGGTVTVKIDVDTKGVEILAVDALLEYDPKLLEVSLITDNDFLVIGEKDKTVAGRIYIAGIVKDPISPQKGIGTLVTLSFKALKNGTDTLKFICKDGATAEDSNIAKNDINATDIIECGQNGTSQITIGDNPNPDETITPADDGEPTPTGSDTLNPAPTTRVITRAPVQNIGGDEEPTPTGLIKAGPEDAIIKFAVPGMFLLIVGIGMRLLL